MTPNQQKEELSKAYLHAIAARCSYAIGTWSQDADGIDTTIAASIAIGADKHVLADPKLDVQLKCTSDAKRILASGHVLWSIKRSLYNKMIQRSQVPKVLVVLVLPGDEAEWLSHSADALVLRRCAFWTTITGRDEDTSTQESTTVHIPQSNVFSPEALQAIMDRVSREQLP